MVLDSIYRVSRGGSVKRERKDGLLLHASIFCRVFFLHYLPLSFFFVLLLEVFLPIFSMDSSSPYLGLPLSFLYYLIPWDFSLLSLRLHQPFFSLGTFLQDYPLTHCLLDHYLRLECVCCTTPHSRTKLLILFLPFLLSILLEWIRIRVSLFTYSYGMHRVVQALCLPLLGELPSQQGIFPKEGSTRISK